MTKAFYVAFEGIDGCGKGTQAKLLYEALVAQGRNVVLTREPVTEELTLLARTLTHAVGSKDAKPARQTYALVFAADRSEHIQKLVKPALLQGKDVVSDRCYLSSIAFQTVFDGIDEAWVRMINSFAPKPDAIILLDLDPLEASRRVEGQKRRIAEFELLEKQLEIRRKYLELAAKDGCVVVDASGTREEVSAKILSELKSRKLL